jgi:hypothetical protein
VTVVARTAEVRDTTSLIDIVREIAVAGFAGLIVGPLVGGLGGRLFMRVAGAVTPEAMQGASTEAGFTIGEITLEGTLGLMIFAGIPAGIAGATLFVIFAPWLGWAGRWRGVAFGVVLFAVTSAVSDVMNPDNVDFRLIRNEAFLVASIVALFLAFGASMDAVVRRLDRRLPAAELAAIGWRLGWGAIAVIGLVLGGTLLPVALFTSSFCDCDPPFAAASFVAVTAVGTVSSWFVGGSGARIRDVVRAIGYAGLAGTTVFGLARALSDAAEIIS